MVLKRYCLIMLLIFGIVIAQGEKPLLVGGSLLTAVYPGGFGISYVEAEPFAKALGLSFWQDDGQVILGLGSHKIRFLITAAPSSKTALKKLVTSANPPALRRGDAVIIPLRYASRALGAIYSGSEASLRVVLPEAELVGVTHLLGDGRDVIALKLTRDVNVYGGDEEWWIFGLRTSGHVRDVQGLYLSRLRFEPSPYGTRFVMEGALGWPVEVVSFPGEVRFYIGPKPEQQSTRRIPLVVIDPGHGGYDVGARYGNLTEKDIALRVAREVGALLKRRGYRVALTRERDQDVSPFQRAQWAARADVFISIHLSGGRPAVPGPVIYRYAGERSDVPLFVARARTLIGRGGYQDVLRHFARSAGEVAAFSNAVEEELGRIGLTARRAETPIYVLEHAPGAALLIELGSLNNSTDRARLANNAQQSAYAQVISRAITRFLGVQP